MALKFTVHVVIKGHRKSGVILIKHSRDMKLGLNDNIHVIILLGVNTLRLVSA